MVKIKYKIYTIIVVIIAAMGGIAISGRFPAMDLPLFDDRSHLLMIYGSWISSTQPVVHVTCLPCGTGNSVDEHKTQSPYIESFDYDGQSPVRLVVEANQFIVVSCIVYVDGDAKKEQSEPKKAKCNWN